MPDHTPLAALESALSRYEAIPPAPEDAPSYIKAQTEAKRTRALLEFTAHCTPETVRAMVETLNEKGRIQRRLTRWEVIEERAARVTAVALSVLSLLAAVRVLEVCANA